ncbi:MAG: 23S rRNA (pseudouridine(1915)-N(3))-methyltransferase RlmH [Candidatus Peribacteraceae bacterium]
MRIKLLCIGSVKTSWIREGCGEYLRRNRDVELIELPASKQRDTEKQAAEESARILKKLTDDAGEVWVLDERGSQVSSRDFAAALASLHDSGTSVAFVIGGAYGLDDSVRKRANRILSLSAMTLPHELARLLFLEQLYRAQEIQKGSGYHHGA